MTPYFSNHSDQWQVLCDSFGLVDAEHRNPDTSIWLPQLLDHEQCEKLLYQLTPLINSPSLKVTASLLSKRYAYLATAASLYAMTVYDVGIDMSAQNCFLDYSYKEGLWQSKMPISNYLVNRPTDSADRVVWRKKVVSNIFANNLALLWQVLVDVTKVHPRILWENTAVRVYSLYEKKITTTCPIMKEKIEEDYAYLIKEAMPEVFGIDHNPLGRYDYKKIKLTEDSGLIRLRKSCCFYYKATQPMEYCSNCPLLVVKDKKIKRRS